MDPTKLHPALRSTVETQQAAGEGQRGPQAPLRCIVKYTGATSRPRAADAGAGTQFRLINAEAATLSLQELDQLTERDDVEIVWADLPVYALLDVSVPIIRVPEVIAAGFTGRGVTIAVVDTGIDAAHPDLAGRVAAQKDFTGEGDGDGNGHGTHVASIAAGTGAASNGKYKGVAPEATLMAARVLGSNGSGSQSGVMAGIEWAVEQGARVINLSLGGPPEPGDGTDALSTQVDAAVRAGVVCVVAAGNSGRNGSRTVGSPGAAREAITIGATVSQAGSVTDRVTDFSSRGPTADGRVKPDVCFPGYQIVAARADETSMGTPVDEHYTSASGTSMATPHAAGAAALILQAHPELTPAQVKERMMRAGRDMGLEPNTQGTGRVDVWAFLNGEQGAPLTEQPTPTPPPPTPPPPTPPPPTPTPTPPPAPNPPSGCLPVLIVGLAAALLLWRVSPAE